jgi:hypothetical protein
MFLLPWLFWLLVAMCLMRSGRSWRDAMLLGAVAWGLAILVLAELASAIGQLDGVMLGALWTLIVLVAAAAAWRRPRLKMSATHTPPANWPRSERMPWLLLTYLLLLLAAVGLTAIVAPPNTYDTMTYHLPRVMHWLQQGSLSPYSALDERHIFMSPWPALAQLHAMALIGSDRLANTVQWTSYVICVAGASGIAAALGGGRRTQVATAAVTASLPMALLQGATTQSDLIASGWLVIMTYCVLRRWQDDAPDTLHLLGAAAALGLATLSKGTAFPIGAPLAALWLVLELARRSWHAWRVVPALVLVPLLMNLPHAWRNFQAFGEPITPDIQRQMLLNQAHAPNLMAANLLRGIACNLGTTHTPWNDAIARRVIEWQANMGVKDGDLRVTLDSQKFKVLPMVPKPADPEGMGLMVLTWRAVRGDDDGWKNLQELWNRFRPNEDRSGNPLHMILLATAIVGLTLGWRVDRHRTLVGLGVALLAGYVLFSVQVKWQLWIMRLQLPWLTLTAIWSAALIGHWWGPRPLAAIAWVLIVAATPYALRSEMRPLLGPKNLWIEDRQSLYFHHFGNMREPYRQLAQMTHDRPIRTLGIIANWSSPEYPLWATYEHMGIHPPYIMHVEAPQWPRHRLRCFFPTGRQPDVIVAWHMPPQRRGTRVLADRYPRLTVAGRTFEATHVLDRLVVFEPSAPPDSP